MPQPFKGNCHSDVSSLSLRPELAKHIGYIAALWSQVELHLAMLIAKMLHVDAQVAIAMYMPVKSESARHAIIEAVAKERLGPDEHTEYLALKKRINNTGNQRNAVVHGIWATPDNDPDGIVLVDQKSYIELFSEQTAFWAKWHAGHPDRKLTDALSRHIASLLRYDEKDFVEIEKNIRERVVDVAKFIHKVSPPNPPLSEPPQPRTTPNPTP